MVTAANDTGLVPEDVSAPDVPTPGRRHDDRTPVETAFRYLAMPLLLVVLLGGLYLYVTGQELDSIETRELVADNLINRTVQHLRLSVISTIAVLLLAIPLGILTTRPRFRRITPVVIGLGNAGQAIPSLGMLGLLYYLARTIDWIPSTGTVPIVVALTGYSFLPILRNTMIGLDQVDRSVLEAGRGMGLPNHLILRRIELPLAVPVILAGVRTALVLNIGTTALAFLLGGGGLGVIIQGGFQVQRAPILLTGAVLVAALALAADYLAGIVEERLTPKGL